jgi:hypothetical protein
MSSRPIASAIAGVREAAARAAWAQWGAIFTPAGGQRAARAIVDPEALLLGSLALVGHEPRLWRVARLWARYGARLLSVQRAKNIQRQFPTSVAGKLGEFARLAVVDGGDVRWRSLAGASTEAASGGRREPQARRVLAGGPALMLRLRLGFGVGIKADVIAHLVGLAGGGATVQQVAEATQYYGRAVRRAIEELTASGFIEARSTAPASYRVDLDKWTRLLGITRDDPPAWRPWSSVYAFVAALDAWASGPAPESAFVLASEARDLMARHARALEPAGVRAPAPGLTRGEGYLEPFRQTLEELSEFLGSAV